MLFEITAYTAYTMAYRMARIFYDNWFASKTFG